MGTWVDGYMGCYFPAEPLPRFGYSCDRAAPDVAELGNESLKTANSVLPSTSRDFEVRLILYREDLMMCHIETERSGVETSRSTP